MSKEELVSKVIQLQRASDRARREHELELWMDLPLSIAQLKCLFFINNSEGTTAGKLAAALRVTPTNVTGIIDRLEKQELVVRTGDPQDRRATSLRTTRKGTDMVVKLRSGRTAYLSEVFSRMSTEDLTLIEKGLEAFLKAAEV
jgi:DNA-binding MarR family transcriptional regulator